MLVQKVPKSRIEQKDQMEATTFFLFTPHNPSYEAYKHRETDSVHILSSDALLRYTEDIIKAITEETYKACFLTTFYYTQSTVSVNVKVLHLSGMPKRKGQRDTDE